MHMALRERLLGIQASLMALHNAGSGLSSATRGSERENFLSEFLRKVFPSPFRFDTGDILDGKSKSGQVDIVVEYPFLPSLPVIVGGPRLYLAEGVAAVVEVKSDIANQWKQVGLTAEALKPLKRHPTMVAMRQGDVFTDIPLFAVGYRGWAKLESVAEHVGSGEVDAILVIEDMLFASSIRFGGMLATGAEALWSMIACLHIALSTLKLSSFDLTHYMPQPEPGTANNGPEITAEHLLQVFKSENRAPVKLDFGLPGITDDTIASIVEYGQKLRVLNLNGAQISDASVPVLAKLNELELLHVRHTQLTREGIERLSIQLANCKIVY